MYAIIVPQLPPCQLLFVRWTREGLLARRSVHYLIWTGVPGSLDPFSLAISPIIPNIVFCTNLRLVLLLINSDQPYSTNRSRSTSHILFILFYILPSHVPQQYFCSEIITLMMTVVMLQVVNYAMGFAVCFAIGLLFVVLFAMCGCCFCCCRNCCGNCGGDGVQVGTAIGYLA